MRAWVKIEDANFQAIFGGTVGDWVAVQTAANGDNSYVYLVALIQVLRLGLNESPFFATSGVPTEQAIQQSAPPDYYIGVIQQQYAQYFASLIIVKTAANPPTYFVTVVLLTGATLSLSVSP